MQDLVRKSGGPAPAPIVKIVSNTAPVPASAPASGPEGGHAWKASLRAAMRYERRRPRSNVMLLGRCKSPRS